MYRDPDKIKELRRRRDELEIEKEQLEEDVNKLHARLGMGAERWRFWPAILFWTVPLILLGLWAWSYLMHW